MSEAAAGHVPSSFGTPSAAYCLLPSGLRLAYTEWPGRAPAFVLVHGLASSRRIWDLVAPRLAARHRVIALDQRGHGESDKPEQGYDYATVTADLEAFLDALGVARPILVGHSWGAGVALHYAATRPMAVSALALIDGGITDFQGAGVSWEQAEQLLAPPRLAGTPRQALLERLRQGPLAGIWSPRIEAIVLANFEVDDQDRVWPRLSYDRHMQVVRALWEQRPPQLYPRLRCPTLIVPARRAPATDRDRLYHERKRAGVAEAERLIPRVVVRWMDDAIHDIPLQRPAELAEALAELAGAVEPVSEASP